MMTQKMVPLKYLSNFWRTLEMPLIYCEVNIVEAQATISIICTNLYDPEVPLWIQDIAKLLEKLKWVLKERLTGINNNQKQWQDLEIHT